MSNLQIFNDVLKWMKFRETFTSSLTLGFVPTMGALHVGHLSLIKRSLAENQKTIVSIYVNETQFNDKNDLKKYPTNLQKDLEMLRGLGVDYVICPTYTQMYKDDYCYRIIENNFSKRFCGKDRPGHFDGVLTVVMKLLNIVRPSVAYFGEKDFQQLTLIKGMVNAFFMNIKIVACPTLRETDGLAMSSRNVLLTKEHRNLAPIFNQTIKMNLTCDEVKQKLCEQGFEVDYVEDYGNRRLGAVRLGNVRLIDNEKI